MKKHIISLLSFSYFTGIVGAATIVIDSYSYGSAPNGTYPDTGGSELTDSDTGGVVWGAASTPSGTDIIPLVGFLNADPQVTFNFSGGTHEVRKVSLWVADSNLVAGVNAPATVTVRTTNSSFTQTFNVTDPVGSGTTVLLTYELSSPVTTDSLVIESTRLADVGHQWTMFSEVSFDTVPEPSSILLLSLSGLPLLRRRR